jgi:hypothetical protein
VGGVGAQKVKTERAFVGARVESPLFFPRCKRESTEEIINGAKWTWEIHVITHAEFVCGYFELIPLNGRAI